ncbi:DUF4184 family protein [Occallatibacter riparius]|uniref:DUF4184 family protein n=1 Tax=Occallatibacter riparius TaxID=1002689 RepID=A0A9J7BHW7_9BACT|nr:DUF4184 family protein [Occallatibacter riparius]UWZ82097.1 DUF4184 family protein [Occallatibacter riparius]
MPFTFAHAAAALPFRRTKLIASGVVIGCFAPDFEYFVRLAPKGGFGHTLPGLFALDLPLGLAVFWLFHKYAKHPLWLWSPNGVRRRVKLDSRTAPFQGVAQIALVLVSILIGAATHILWDSFTHRSFWPYQHWIFLRYTVRLPIAGSVPYYKLLQHASTAIGMIVLWIWFVRQPSNAPIDLPRSGSAKANERIAFVSVSAIALAGGILRAFAGAGVPSGLHRIETFSADAVITTISLFWLGTVIFGVLLHKSSSQT